MFFGFFRFINSSPRLTLYRHIVAVKATIDIKAESTRMLKPRVQAVVTASCYLSCSEFPERLQSLNSDIEPGY